MNFRNRISLDGGWQFCHDPSHLSTPAELGDASWREAQVPLPWQAQFEELRLSGGTGWYSRRFTLDIAQGQAAILHFGAVDYHAAVWLNGQKVGEHEGGYLPFEFDVTALLRPGENELVVRADDPEESSELWPASPFSEIPHGKQSWYGPIGGIWQSVWLEWRSPAHVRSLKLMPNAHSGALAVEAALSAEAAGRVRVLAPNGSEAAHGVLDGSGRATLQLDPAALALWSPDSPALYTVEVTLEAEGRTADKFSAVCGFRTVEARDGRIYLNNQPVYLRGVLDQAYYPETIYTPPSLEYLEEQLRKGKELGLNCFRIHIKVEDPRYYEVADRLGMLVWTEIPNWAHLSAEAARRGEETFRAMVERDGNHPSIIAWTLINENWGTDLPRNPEHRAWLADFYHKAKEIDPTRLVVDNSACCNNFHVDGDLEDFHHYRAIPDHAADWDEWVADFAGRAPWAWAADYADRRRADAPLIVSEFGNWGLPDPASIQEKGRDPWWFETGYEWGEGIVYPHDMPARYRALHMDRVFGDLADFAKQSQDHMARSLAYELSTMRRTPAIGGYVITELTDVHWECNGLMDMQRNIKHGLARYFTPLNQDRVVVIRPQRWSGRPGETLPVELHSYGVDGEERAGTIRWTAGKASGELAAPGGVAQIPLPTEGGLVTVQALWLDGGKTVATCEVEVACVAQPAPATRLRVPGDEELAAALHRLGYAVSADEGDVIVSRRYTEEMQTAVQQGARLLLLAGPDFGRDSGDLDLPVGWVQARQHTAWQGDWATSFSWLRKTGPFGALPGGPLLEMEYAGIMPDAVIVGLPIWALRERSWANLALGWIHKVVSLLAVLPYGHGTMVASTFNLTAEALAENAVAQALFAGMVELTAQQ